MSRLDYVPITKAAAMLGMTEDELRQAIDPTRPEPATFQTAEQKLGVELAPITVPLPAAVDACLGVLYWRLEDLEAHLSKLQTRRLLAGGYAEDANLRLKQELSRRAGLSPPPGKDEAPPAGTGEASGGDQPESTQSGFSSPATPEASRDQEARDDDA